MSQKTREDYLRGMFLLYEAQGERSEGIRSVDLAKELGVSKPSVSAMLAKLSEEGLIKAESYSPIYFTSAGLEQAKRIIRKKRIIESFVTEKLGYSVDEVKEEVHRLEHAFSDESVERLWKMLGKPKKCAHGREIPG